MFIVFLFFLRIVPSPPRSLGNDLSHFPSAYINTRMDAYIIAPQFFKSKMELHHTLYMETCPCPLKRRSGTSFWPI